MTQQQPPAADGEQAAYIARLEREAAAGRALFAGLEQWERDTAYGNLRIGALIDDYKAAVKGADDEQG